jgi:hypothetical protein
MKATDAHAQATDRALAADAINVCVECQVNRRAAEGRLSRCLDCIKSAAQLFRDYRDRRRPAADRCGGAHR